MQSIPELVAEVRKNYNLGFTKTYEWRIKQLRNLHDMLEREEDELFKVLKQDLGKVH